MRYIKKLNKTFYTVELDDKYFLSNMDGLNKRISFEEFDKLNTE